MFAAIALSLSTPAAVPPAAPPRCTAGPVADCLQGGWTGSFTGAEWTFEFTRENGVWSGRYVSSAGKSWHPLLGLTVEGDAVTFSIESRPQVTYRLTLDRASDTLSGKVDIGGFHTLPFTAARKS